MTKEGGSLFRFSLFIFYFSFAFVVTLILPIGTRSQTVAFLTPDRADSSRAFAAKLRDLAGTRLKVLDDSLVDSAYSSVAPATPFNLTTLEGKRIGATIGCDVFLLVRSSTHRRSAFQRAEYYESHAAIYGISSRTGRLVYWKLQTFEAPTGDRSAKLLNDSVGALVTHAEEVVRKTVRNEIEQGDPPLMEEFPDENSPLAKTTRAPVPYRRIKPEYTSQASLYDVKATVDLMVYLDDKGQVVHTENIRWAGYGLDESVERNVRSMNWRPAERNGKPLAMKFLVRYNFKKLE